MRIGTLADFSWPKSVFLDVAGKHSYFRSSKSVHKLKFQVSGDGVRLLKLGNITHHSELAVGGNCFA